VEPISDEKTVSFDGWAYHARLDSSAGLRDLGLTNFYKIMCFPFPTVPQRDPRHLSVWLPAVLTFFSVHALPAGEIILDDFEVAEIFTTADVNYANISAWGSEDGKDDVFDHEISGGQLRRVDLDQTTTRVGAVFRVDLSAVSGPMKLELELVSGDFNDINLHFGIDDGDNDGSEIALDMDKNDPVPNPEVAAWTQVFTDGWAYDVSDNPRYTYDVTTGLVTADLSTDSSGNVIGDFSGYDLVAIYFNSDRDAGIVVDNLKLTFEGPALPPPPLAITGFEYDNDSDEATITWASQEGVFYSIDEAAALTGMVMPGASVWFENQDGVLGLAGETTVTFAVAPMHEAVPRLFFRIREE
jgi:hypothetical protein